jgi:hypothetical protein
MQVQLHDPRRSLMNEMPLSTPIPSNQSPGTKHACGGSSTLRLIGSIIGVSGILGRPVPVRNCAQGRAMTVEYEAAISRR